MKKQNYVAANLQLGVVLVAIILIVSVFKCKAQDYINNPYDSAKAKIIKLLRQNPSSIYNAENSVRLQFDSCYAIIYMENSLVTSVSVKGNEHFINGLFESFQPDAGKQFVLRKTERIFIEKQTSSQWALFIKRK